jgi:hypothetical protein
MIVPEYRGSVVEKPTYPQVEDFENKNLVDLQHFALRIQLAAAGMGSSFLLIFVPNVETISFTVFLVGFLFSTRYALSVSLTTILGWEILASMIFGFSGITFLFKIIAWIIITMMGVAARTLKVQRPYEFAILGALAALTYDLLVTIPYALFFVEDEASFWSVFLTSFILGTYFTVLHTAGNTLLFATIPKLVDTIFPLLQYRFSSILRLDSQHFRPRRSMLLVFVIASILVISLLGYGFSQYDNETAPPEELDTITITISFDYADLMPFEEFILNVSNQDSVLAIMEKVVVVNYTLEFKNQPYIEAINGIWNMVNISTFNWIFYVNGARSDRGASIKYVQHQDLITWVYE